MSRTGNKWRRNVFTGIVCRHRTPCTHKYEYNIMPAYATSMSFVYLYCTCTWFVLSSLFPFCVAGRRLPFFIWLRGGGGGAKSKERAFSVGFKSAFYFLFNISCFLFVYKLNYDTHWAMEYKKDILSGQKIVNIIHFIYVRVYVWNIWT